MPFVPSFVGSSKSTHKKRKSCHFDVIVGAMRRVLKYRLADFCPNNARVAAHFRAAKLVIRDCHPQSFAVCNCKKIRKYLYPQRFISPIAQIFDSVAISHSLLGSSVLFLPQSLCLSGIRNIFTPKEIVGKCVCM